MSVKYFLDTSIFVTSFDKQDLAKQSQARGLISQALQGKGCTSWQVIQEFTNTAMRGFEGSFDHPALREYYEVVLLPLCSLFPDKGLYLEAVGVQQETRFSWYDSLMITSAIRLSCAILYSESLPHGHLIRGLKLVNPFQ